MFTSILLAACLATELYALPLNINLGAYSPALVVGDGEISFGGDQDVSNLMNALEGAAVTNAQNNGAAAPGVEAQPQQEQAQVAPVPTTSAVPRETQNQEVQNLPQGMGRKEIDPRSDSGNSLVRRAIEGLDAALNYATNALKAVPEVQLGTGEGGSGVGITVKAGAQNGQQQQQPQQEARSVTTRDVDGLAAGKLKTTVTTMFIRGGPAAERNLVKRTLASSPAPRKRSESSAINAVNLNMAEGQVAELTFVETSTAGGEEEE